MDCNELFFNTPGQVENKKRSATKAVRHEGYVFYSFLVPWCLRGKMKK
jgi:hypothetical protein